MIVVIVECGEGYHTTFMKISFPISSSQKILIMGEELLRNSTEICGQFSSLPPSHAALGEIGGLWHLWYSYSYLLPTRVVSSTTHPDTKIVLNIERQSFTFQEVIHHYSSGCNLICSTKIRSLSKKMDKVNLANEHLQRVCFEFEREYKNQIDKVNNEEKKLKE